MPEILTDYSEGVGRELSALSGIAALIGAVGEDRLNYRPELYGRDLLAIGDAIAVITARLERRLEKIEAAQEGEERRRA